MEKIIAIDFGTKKSVIGVIENDIPFIIPNKIGKITTPSAVAFTKEGKPLIGEAAIGQTNINHENTIWSIQSLMGKHYTELIDKIKTLPYKVINSSDGDIRIKIRNSEYSPIYIASLILQYLRESAEHYLEERITTAIITIPVNFNEFQKEALRKAAKIARIETTVLINQSAIVALLYAFNNKKEDEIETLCIINFGSSTFNISIVEIFEGSVLEQAVSGDSNLGGDDFDQRIIDWMIEYCKKEYSVDLKDDYIALQLLKEAAEKAKVELSELVETNIKLFITLDQSDRKCLIRKLTRTQFELLIEDLLERAIEHCRTILSETGLKPSDIDRVVIVGGTSRIPIFKKLIKLLFGQEPYEELNSFEAPVIGGAIQSGILKGGIEGTFGNMILGRVTPFSLGIETNDGNMMKIIGRNSSTPTQKSTIVTTANDMQTSVAIHILQGESAIAKNNWRLERIDLTDIRPVHRGIPQIEITFSIVGEFIEVSAKDLETGRIQQKIITPQRLPIKVSIIDKYILPAMLSEDIEEKQTPQEVEVLQILRKRLEKSDTEETLLEKIMDIVEIKPSFFGVGIDFSKLVKRLIKKKDG